MEHIGTQPLQSERTFLRRFTLDDAEQMFKNYCNNDEICKYVTWKPHGNIETTKSYIDFLLNNYNKENFYNWAIVLKETNEVIGSIDAVDVNTENNRIELGWVLSNKYWGQGIMPEVATKLIDFFFNLGAIRIQAKHIVENTKSGRVMEKLEWLMRES